MLNDEETLAQKFVKKGFWLYLFTFLVAPLSYIVKVVLARDLDSVHDFGLFYGIISLITLLSALNDLGCTESLNYFLPKYLIKKEYGKAKYLLRMVLIVQILSSLLIIGGLFMFSDFLAEHYFRDPQAAALLKIISFFFLGTNLIHICTAIFSATQNTKLQKGTEFVRMGATVIFTLLIFFLDRGSLEIYTWTWLSGVFVAIAFALYYAHRDYWRAYFQGVPVQKDVLLRREFMFYAIPTFLTANIGVILSQVDAQLVTFLIGNEAQGYYSNYLSVLGIPFLFVSPIVAFLFPVIAELFTR